MTRRPRKLTRRHFLRSTSVGATLFSIVPRHVLGDSNRKAANERINIAGIGVGGQGWSDIRAVGNENVVALCDVDTRQAAKAFERFPKAKRYRDFRKMLDAMDHQIDAVVVAIPDHAHAVAVADAIRRGKHVYCEKPLAHSIHEVRRLMQLAQQHKVITQLGNQGHSSGSIRTFCEWIWDGAIGEVKEVHAFCDAFKNVYCQIDKLPLLKEKEKVPPELDWDLWLGPTRFRPYHRMFCPWNWRGWTRYGTGAIGDWVCHVVDPSFWALDLGAPVTVHANVEGYDPKKDAEVYPPGTEITYQFPAKGDRGPIKLVWYDGNKRPPRPSQLEPGRNPPGTGEIVIGDQGAIMHGSHGAGGVRIIPEAKMRAYKKPEPTIPRAAEHHQDWLQAIRQGRQAGSNFDYGGPLTEIGLLGLIAIRFPGTTLQWDAENMRFSNCDEASACITPQFRPGWTL